MPLSPFTELRKLSPDAGIGGEPGDWAGVGRSPSGPGSSGEAGGMANGISRILLTVWFHSP